MHHCTLSADGTWRVVVTLCQVYTSLSWCFGKWVKDWRLVAAPEWNQMMYLLVEYKHTRVWNTAL